MKGICKCNGRINNCGNFSSPCVVALGFFESVHLGHKKLLETTVMTAKELSLELPCKSEPITKKNNVNGMIEYVNEMIERAVPIVVTFENLPFTKTDEAFDICTLEERLDLIFACGIEVIFTDVFNEEFAKISATEFLDRLFGKFDIKAIVVGEDYHFGHDRLGDIEFLKNYARKKNVELFALSDVEYLGERISTTRIKREFRKGNIVDASKMLGRGVNNE